MNVKAQLLQPIPRHRETLAVRALHLSHSTPTPLPRRSAQPRLPPRRASTGGAPTRILIATQATRSRDACAAVLDRRHEGGHSDATGSDAKRHRVAARQGQAWNTPVKNAPGALREGPDIGPRGHKKTRSS